MPGSTRNHNAPYPSSAVRSTAVRPRLLRGIRDLFSTEENRELHWKARPLSGASHPASTSPAVSLCRHPPRTAQQPRTAEQPLSVLHTANNARYRRQLCLCPSAAGSHPSPRGDASGWAQCRVRGQRRGRRRRHSSPDRDPTHHSQEGAVPSPLEDRRRRHRRGLELWRRRRHAQRGPDDWPVPPSPRSQLE